MKIKSAVKRILIYFILIVFAFILQTCIFPIFSFLSAAPNILLILTFSYGFIYGSATGIICGLFAGFMMDIFYSEPFGLFILIYSYLGFFSGLFSDGYRNDSIVLPLILCFICDASYNAAMIIYRIISLGFSNMSFIIKNLVLPEIFFTLLVTLASYHILLKTNRKLDLIDDLRGQDAA